MEPAGGVVVQLKSTMGSVRINVGCIEKDELVKAALVTFAQYEPWQSDPGANGRAVNKTDAGHAAVGRSKLGGDGLNVGAGRQGTKGPV